MASIIAVARQNYNDLFYYGNSGLIELSRL